MTKHINKCAESAGHISLSTICQSKVRTILEEAEIKPNKTAFFTVILDFDCFLQPLKNLLNYRFCNCFQSCKACFFGMFLNMFMQIFQRPKFLRIAKIGWTLASNVNNPSHSIISGFDKTAVYLFIEKTHAALRLP